MTFLFTKELEVKGKPGNISQLNYGLICFKKNIHEQHLNKFQHHWNSVSLFYSQHNTNQFHNLQIKLHYI